MDALEKLGLKRRIVAVEVEGFGTVRLQDLTAAEWRECIEAGGEEARKLLARSIVDENGVRVLADDFPIEDLPPILVKMLVDKVSHVSGFSEDAAKN